MENKPTVPVSITITPNEEYKGPTPLLAAVKDFFFDMALFTFPFLGFSRDGKWSWIDKSFLGIGTAFGLWDGRRAYKQTQAAEDQHYRLVAENKLMRTQLVQTGQVLDQVASNLAQQRDALTTKIEARTRGTAIKAPAASYAEEIQAAAAEKANAQPTIH